MPAPTRQRTLCFPCGSCGRSLVVSRLLAGALTRCPHCLRWMFAPAAPLTDRELDRTQAGIETVVDGLPVLRRPAEPAAEAATSADEVDPAVVREALDRLITAVAFRKVGRLADAADAAAQARRRLTEAVRAVDGLLADLKAALDRLPAADPAEAHPS